MILAAYFLLIALTLVAQWMLVRIGRFRDQMLEQLIVQLRETLQFTDQALSAVTDPVGREAYGDELLRMVHRHTTAVQALTAAQDATVAGRVMAWTASMKGGGGRAKKAKD
jgi:hypothetical protein